MNLARRESEPWRTVEGIEFRSVTIVATKPEEGPCLERNQAVIYRGPFSAVVDDDGHSFERGQATAICERTFRMLQNEPYADSFVSIEPNQKVSLDQAQPFDCDSRTRRPSELKGDSYRETKMVQDCDGDGCC